MRRFVSLMGLLLLLTASLSLHAADHTVTVGGGTPSNPQNFFFPADITINVGDTITFVHPFTADPHNVHATDGSFRCALGCDASGGNGNPTSTAYSDTVTFNQAGTIPFQCDPHASMGMRGTITVTGGPPPPTNVAITSGFTGTWYDPTQSGHGIFLEIEPNNGVLAWWFTFSPGGEQAWFGNVGTIDPATNIATVEPLQTQGGEWIPNFNPANVTQPQWGTLTFQFSDCNHGRVDFTSTVSGYGTGHMDLTRLTEPAGLSCP
jgi:plastocyanin